MRLIDADALIDDIDGDLTDSIAEGKAIEKIMNAPSIDAVLVVRCKDCKYKCETEDGEWNPEDVVCSYWDTDGLEENDYCSYAERKEDG